METALENLSKDDLLMGISTAFLLGSEIEIKTKRHRESMGYKFVTTIDTQQIELLREGGLEDGTEIKIRLTKDIFNRLSPKSRTKLNLKWFEWYTLDFPKIKLKYGGKLIPLGFLNPDITSSVPNYWHELDFHGYKKVRWTYDQTANDAKFTCNGIVIPQDPSTNGTRLGLFQHLPKIQVFDSEGTLPINLSRNGFSAKLPFNSELERDVSKDFLAYLLTMEIQSSFEIDDIELYNDPIKYPGLLQKGSAENYGYGRLSYVNTSAFSIPKYPLLSKKGYILDYPYFIKQIDNPKALFINGLKGHLTIKDSDIQDYFIKYSSKSISTLTDYKSVIEPKEYGHSHAPALFVMERELYEYLFNKETRRLSTTTKSNGVLVKVNEKWCGVDFGLRRNSILETQILSKLIARVKMIRDYDVNVSNDGNGILNGVLQEYLGKDVIIPYDLEARKKKYPLAFVELGKYMEKYLPKNKG